MVQASRESFEPQKKAKEKLQFTVPAFVYSELQEMADKQNQNLADLLRSLVAVGAAIKQARDEGFKKVIVQDTDTKKEKELLIPFL